MKQRATVVCQRGTQILLVSRDGTRWSLPGGKPTLGEDLREAAMRELMEETRLRAIDMHYLFGFTGTRTCHHVFIAKITDGELAVPSNEITRCSWVEIAEVANWAISVSTKGIVDILSITSDASRLASHENREATSANGPLTLLHDASG